MLLGQLYHYDALLDKFEFPLTTDNAQELELLGLEKSSTQKPRQISNQELRLEIRDLFSRNYGRILLSNNLITSHNLWSQITSPYKVSKGDHPSDQTEFQTKLQTWIKEGVKWSEIDDLLVYGKLTTEESDVALYYGLKTLFLLSHEKPRQRPKVIQIPDLMEASDLSDNPQILICSHPEFFPLFKNLNCQTSNYLSDAEQMVYAIQEDLKSNPNISLVLIISPESENSIEYITKKLQSQVLVSTLDLQVEDLGKDTFFDKIVKKTLGVRLSQEA
jgi:hypothetical protein